MPDYDADTNQPNLSNPQADPSAQTERNPPIPQADSATDILDAENKGLNDPEDATATHGDIDPDLPLDDEDDFDPEFEDDDDPDGNDTTSEPFEP